MKKKILIIDDEQDLLELFSDILRSAGFEVSTAFDGQKGLEVMLQDKPDLVLLDIVMPNVDGFAMLREMKQKPELLNVKVIVLSNMQGQEYIDQATELGADDYWYKMNTHLTDLVEKVKHQLA